MEVSVAFRRAGDYHLGSLIDDRISRRNPQAGLAK
jgi:hypothetical protein